MLTDRTFDYASLVGEILNPLDNLAIWLGTEGMNYES